MNEVPMATLAPAIFETGALKGRNELSNFWRHQSTERGEILQGSSLLMP